MLLRVALLFTVTDACPRVRETHYLLPTTSNGFGNQYYAIEKAAWLAFANFSPTDPGNSDYEFVNGIVKSSGKDLKALVDLAEAGKLKCCVDEHFPFDKVPEALSKSLTARSGGKLIIDVA